MPWVRRCIGHSSLSSLQSSGERETCGGNWASGWQFHVEVCTGNRSAGGGPEGEVWEKSLKKGPGGPFIGWLTRTGSARGSSPACFRIGQGCFPTPSALFLRLVKACQCKDICIYFLERQRERERDRPTDRPTICSSWLAQAESRNQELYPGLLHEWQKPKSKSWEHTNLNKVPGLLGILNWVIFPFILAVRSQGPILTY